MSTNTTNFGELNCVTDDISMSLSLETRFSVPIHFLFAACRSAKELARVEDKKNAERVDEDKEEVIHHSFSVAILTVACLEGYLNELFFDKERTFKGLDKEFLNKFLEFIEYKSILDKYEFILLSNTSNRLEKGRNVVQNIGLLIGVRNAIVHFKPEWPSSAEKHDKITSQLRGKVANSPLYPGEPLFPKGFVSKSFAIWAIKSTIEFIDYFYRAIGLDSPLDSFKNQIISKSGGLITL